MPKQKNNELPAEHRDELLKELKERFDANMARHKGVRWADVQAKLESNPEKLLSLAEMARTGGEPDVVALDNKSAEIVFVDCSPETPKGRRSLCFDRKAWESRKEHKPATSAVEMAAAIGVEMLSEDEYRELQKLGEFDLKTSSWVATADETRALGGALFCDRRFGRVFTYHNGAESYYAARGFRGRLNV